MKTTLVLPAISRYVECYRSGVGLLVWQFTQR